MVTAKDNLSSLQLLVRMMNEPACILDVDHVITFANEAWANLFDLNPSQLTEVVTGDDHAKLAYAYAQVGASGQPHTLVLRLNALYAAAMIQLRVVPFMDVSPTALVVMAKHHNASTDATIRRTEELQSINRLLQQEITERIRAEEEANRIYTLSVDMLGIVDVDGRFMKINPAWSRTLGYAAEALLGTSLLDYVHDEDYETTQLKLDVLAIQPSHYLTFEHRFRHFDDAYRWLSWNAFQNADDGMIYFVARDVTERKQIDVQLRLLNKAVEASNSAITIADIRLLDAPLVYVNPAFEHITGYTAEEILGRNCRFLQRDDRDQSGIEIIREAVKHYKPCTVTLRNYRKDGSLFWNELRLTPMQDAHGEHSHYVGVATDITERIEAEQRIKSQNEALLRTNKALAEARKQAEAATRLKSEFLATMSHELRTPMNAVIGYTEIMLAGMTGAINAEQEDYLHRVLTNAEHLLALINDVLDLSKIEAGRVDLIRKPYHLAELLSEIEAQTRGLAEEKGLEFACMLDAALPTVLVGDPDRLKQIAINLLSNAIKFTSSGSVRIALRLHGSSTWTLTVRDTGIGIPKANQKAIFEEFRQLDATWQRQHGGTGLGLAIVRKLALLMGGSIRVQSVPDEGSTFTVFLPIERERTNKTS